MLVEHPFDHQLEAVLGCCEEYWVQTFSYFHTRIWALSYSKRYLLFTCLFRFQSIMVQFATTTQTKTK